MKAQFNEEFHKLNSRKEKLAVIKIRFRNRLQMNINDWQGTLHYKRKIKKSCTSANWVPCLLTFEDKHYRVIQTQFGQVYAPFSRRGLKMDSVRNTGDQATVKTEVQVLFRRDNARVYMSVIVVMKLKELAYEYSLLLYIVWI